MIEPIEMFGATCDSCGEQWEHAEGWTAMADKGFVKEGLDDAEWHQSDDGKTYCPNCFRIDDEDNLILTKNEAP